MLVRLPVEPKRSVMGKRRKYMAEFKREAVALASDPGVTLSQVARELGISTYILGRWSREMRELGPRALGRPGKAPG